MRVMFGTFVPHKGHTVYVWRVCISCYVIIPNKKHTLSVAGLTLSQCTSMETTNAIYFH